ncbi:MAG: alpha/beta hydrolase [Erythrobacter sp.]|uniref:alpha/beta hydrolase n=1 Tax=Erythrobacter sp. TaxID=1042 RepID=UPI003299EE7A
MSNQTTRKSKGPFRIMASSLGVTLGVLIGIAILAAIGLQIAISRDGPAVLSAVDRIAGGTSGAELKAKIATGDHPEQKLMVWGSDDSSQNETLRPVLLFVHGGSWNSGDPESYGFVGRAFVKQGFIVVLGGYRLGEAGKYPAMIEDTARAIAWTHEEIEQYGGDPQNIVIAGHSAGAYNVMMTALQDTWLARHSLSSNDIAGVVGLSGPYDFLPLDSESTIASFGHVEEGKALSATQPINHVNSGAPAKLLIHGEKDTLVKMRHSRALAGLAGDAGVDVGLELYPEMTHSDPLISIAAPWRERRDIVQKISDFVRQQTASE